METKETKETKETVLDAVKAIMSQGQWMSIPNIAAQVGERVGRPLSDTNISARVRELRSIHKRTVNVTRENGMYLYRMSPDA